MCIYGCTGVSQPCVLNTMISSGYGSAIRYYLLHAAEIAKAIVVCKRAETCPWHQFGTPGVGLKNCPTLVCGDAFPHGIVSPETLKPNEFLCFSTPTIVKHYNFNVFCVFVTGMRQKTLEK